MYGFDDLKPHLTITDTTVACPVLGCSKTVRRRRRGDKPSPDFCCPVHGLDLSPSTFAYPSETDNMLWTDPTDLSLLQQIKRVKRESRLAANNSEDAVTWNVFRGLQREGLLATVVSALTGFQLQSPRLLWWSWAPTCLPRDHRGAWEGLNSARLEFGETVARGSEPDLIVLADNALIFLEAKLTASNRTKPSRSNLGAGYCTGGNHWFAKVFHDTFQTIAEKEQRYELLRFWLLGTWLANERRLPFRLLNLVLKGRETGIEDSVGPFLRQHDDARFLRRTWEDIRDLVARETPTPGRKRLLRYFETHTIGYNNGVLQPAFE